MYLKHILLNGWAFAKNIEDCNIKQGTFYVLNKSGISKRYKSQNNP